jgi:hypothetical protein
MIMCTYRVRRRVQSCGSCTYRARLDATPRTRYVCKLCGVVTVFLMCIGRATPSRRRPICVSVSVLCHDSCPMSCAVTCAVCYQMCIFQIRYIYRFGARCVYRIAYPNLSGLLRALRSIRHAHGSCCQRSGCVFRSVYPQSSLQLLKLSLGVSKPRFVLANASAPEDHLRLPFVTNSSPRC